jgi:hypothetical protein
MARLNYKQALDAVLAPMGFTYRDHSAQYPGIGKRERVWDRERDGFRESVFLGYSNYFGMTADFLLDDLTTRALYKEARPGGDGLLIRTGRISEITGGAHSGWFKDDPHGPEALAALVKELAEPWFNEVRSLEDQAVKWYYRGTPSKGTPTSREIGLALTLYRMGEFDEAIAAADVPPRRTRPKSWADDVYGVRDWLIARVAEERARKE